MIFEKTNKLINSKNNIFKRERYVIICIYIIITIIIIIPNSKSGRIRNLNGVYEIGILLDGTIECMYNGESKPDEMIIDGVREEVNMFYMTHFDGSKKYITVIWHKQPSCSELFKNCGSFLSIDLSNFDSSGITDMSEMFASCNHLKSINFKNFDTSSVITMEKMFFNCVYLKFLDLSNFITNSLTNMEDMFSNDISLVSVDLSQFDTSLVTNMKSTFSNCQSLIYLNIYSFTVNENTEIGDFISITSPAKFCFDKNKIKISNSFLSQIPNQCNDICFQNGRKIDFEAHKCLENCNDEKYVIEIDNFCYKTIPDDYEIPSTDEETEYSGNKETQESPETSEISESNEKSESDKSTEKSESAESTEKNENAESTEKSESVESTENDEGIESNEETENIQISDKLKLAINNIIIKETQVFNEKILLDEDILIKNIRENIINRNLSSFLSNLLDGTTNDIISDYNSLTYQITTTENQKNKIYNNISTINLGDCEDKLKFIYGIGQNLSLIILKVEYNIKGLLIPVIGYEVYHPQNYSQLDLNYCNETLITLNIPVTIDENKAFKYDPNSDYYNDECFAFTSDNGTDIILNDRKNEYIDKNLSLCENNCAFNGYDSNTKKALCECETKISNIMISEILKEDNLLANNFNNSDDNNVNLGTMKCISLLFSKNGLLTNIGSYILICSIFFFAISLAIFYKCGCQIIEDDINDILELKLKHNKEIDIYDHPKNPKTNKIEKYKKKKNTISNPKKKNYKKILKLTKVKKIFNGKKKETTPGSKSEIKMISIKKEKINCSDMTIINMNKNNKKRKTIKIGNYKEFELNYFSYKEARQLDKRTFFQLYFYLIKTKVPIFFEFYPINDYNLKIIKISLFFLFFDIYFAINTLFFTDSTIHQIYKDGGKYNFGYFLPQIIYSFIICYIINSAIKFFTLLERNILEAIKGINSRNKLKKVFKIKRCLIIKYIIFYALSNVFLILFWFYLSSFCAVYQNTQIYLIINTLMSCVVCIIFSFIFILLPSTFRFLSLNVNKAKYECFYKASQILQII